MDITQLTTFFGWTAFINIALLVFTTIILIAFKGSIAKLHSSMFSVDEDKLYQSYLNFIACYKVVIIVLSIVPYLALKAMM